MSENTKTATRATALTLQMEVRRLERRDQTLKTLSDRALMLHKVHQTMTAPLLPVAGGFDANDSPYNPELGNMTDELMYAMLGAARRGHAATIGLALDLMRGLAEQIQAGHLDAASELGRVASVLAHRRRDLQDWIKLAHTFHKPSVDLFTTMLNQIGSAEDNADAPA